MYKPIVLFISFLASVAVVSAQSFPVKNYPRDAFRYPLDIPLKLNANFGEMRPNHFHMGLDLFTERRENLPVYAPADGWVSRIKVEPGGFGNAIYVSHPNGFTTLYAHMNTFLPEVARYVKQQQYAQESWRVELQIPEGRFPVKKGSFLGYSGNTGASAGPHVHYEIRRTVNDACVNPLLLYKVYDITPPDISRIAVYDRNQSTYEQQPRIFPVVHAGGIHTISGGTITVSSNRISFALVATDRVTGVPNNNGIYEVTVWMDDQPISGFQIDDVDYLQTRYLNAHIDYRIKTSGGAYFQHVTPLPGDRLPIYQTWKDDGIINLRDTAVHRIQMVVKDANGNATPLRFNVKWNGQRGSKVNERDGRYFFPNSINVFEREDVQVVTSEKSLYDAIRFQYAKKASVTGYSDVHNLHTPLIPLHDYIAFRIKPNKNIPDAASDRVIMVKEARGKTEVVKALEVNDFYEARFREFGAFRLEADVTAPTITVAGVVNGGVLPAGGKIVCTVTDQWKKIKNFRATLNGNWIMFSNSGSTWRYAVDEKCPPGNYELVVTAEDEAGNIATKSIQFIRK